MVTARAFGPKLAGVNPALSIAFLERLGDPWHVVVAGRVRTFARRNAAQLADHIRGQQTAGQSVLALLPSPVDGAHQFLVGRLPLTSSPAKLNPPPQFILCADDYTCIWRLVAPVLEAQARRMTQRLVAPEKGKEAINQPVPLPGCMLIRAVGIGMTTRFPTSLLPPLKLAAYHFVGDQLQTEKAAEAADPFTIADAMEIEPTAWLWPGVMPAGEFAILAGPPKVGKSSIAVDLAARITRGAAWPDEAAGGPPAGVILLENEDPQNVTRARLAAAGADLRKVSMSDVIVDLSAPAGLAMLARQAERLRDVSALFLSPVRLYFGEQEASRQIDMRQRLAPLLEWSSAHGVAVIGIAHREPKSKGKSAEDVAGPRAIIQRARTVLSVGIDDTDPLAKRTPNAARRILSTAGANLASDGLALPYRIEGVTVDNIATSRVVWVR
jgi:hypothetical protein